MHVRGNELDKAVSMSDFFDEVIKVMKKFGIVQLGCARCDKPKDWKEKLRELIFDIIKKKGLQVKGGVYDLADLGGFLELQAFIQELLDEKDREIVKYQRREDEHCKQIARLYEEVEMGHNEFMQGK